MDEHNIQLLYMRHFQPTLKPVSYFVHPAASKPSANCRAHSINTESVLLPTNTLMLNAAAPSRFVSTLQVWYCQGQEQLALDRHIQMHLDWKIVPRVSV